MTPTVVSNLLKIAEPVYKIVNYNSNGSHTCLDANGNDIADGGAVTSYGCDPNQANQTNQLWIVAGNQFDPANTHDGVSMSDGSLIPPMPLPGDASALSYGFEIGRYSLVNLASVVNNGMTMNNSLTLSSTASNMLGENSQSLLWNPIEWPANGNNSLYGFTLLVPSTNPSQTPACEMFACLLGE